MYALAYFTARFRAALTWALARALVMKYQLKKEALESIPTQREQNEKKMKKLVAEVRECK